MKKRAGEQFEVYSAGTERTRVQPLAIEAMRESGIDITGHWSKTLGELTDAIQQRLRMFLILSSKNA